jgi:hypothetical protein
MGQTRLLQRPPTCRYGEESNRLELIFSGQRSVLRDRSQAMGAIDEYLISTNQAGKGLLKRSIYT